MTSIPRQPQQVEINIPPGVREEVVLRSNKSLFEGQFFRRLALLILGRPHGDGHTDDGHGGVYRGHGEHGGGDVVEHRGVGEVGGHRGVIPGSGGQVVRVHKVGLEGRKH